MEDVDAITHLVTELNVSKSKLCICWLIKLQSRAAGALPGLHIEKKSHFA